MVNYPNGHKTNSIQKVNNTSGRGKKKSMPQTTFI